MPAKGQLVPCIYWNSVHCPDGKEDGGNNMNDEQLQDSLRTYSLEIMSRYDEANVSLGFTLNAQR